MHINDTKIIMKLKIYAITLDLNKIYRASEKQLKIWHIELFIFN